MREYELIPAPDSTTRRSDGAVAAGPTDGVRPARLGGPVPAHAELLPDRVPDGLELEERGDLPRALRVRLAVHDALDVVRRRALEVRRAAVGAREVERVHIHMRGKPRRKLPAPAGKEVDDAARDVGGRERLGELDRRERTRL